MKILVQKFGGTSVSTPERRQQVADKILNAVNQGYCPVVVVSALGRKGEPYATDTLIQLAKQECPSIDQRELDMIMSCGEVVAGVVVSATLKGLGIEAVVLNGQQAGIITTAVHGDAQVLNINPKKILEQVAQNKVAIVTGFQGVTEAGDITTLGRGGSDTTAAAIGAAVKAESVDIYTDVDGMLTADPRAVKEAKKIPAITYEEAHQMALHGAKVIHPRAVEIAMRYNIPLKVKSTFSDGEGTLIAADPEGTLERLKKGKAVVGIAHQAGYGVLRMHNSKGFNFKNTEGVFKELAAAGGDQDFISFAEKDMEIIAAQPVIEAIGEICAALEFEIEEKVTDCIKISLIGRGISYDSGIFAAFTELLYRNNIKVLGAFTGQFSVSAIVAADCAEQAMAALHKDFF